MPVSRRPMKTVKIMSVNVCKRMLDVWEVFNKCQCNLCVHNYTPQRKRSEEKSCNLINGHRMKVMWVNVCKRMLDIWGVFNKCQCNPYVHHFTPQTKGSGEKSGILMVTELQMVCEPKCMLNVGEVFKMSVHSFTPQREGSGGKSGSLMVTELLSGVSGIPSPGGQIPVSSDHRNYHQMTSLKDFK